MSRHLFELVEFQKNVRKVVKDRFKSLRKRAKKARKGDEELSLEEARQELDGSFELLTSYMDTAATREAGEVAARADLEVDGQVILRDVPPRLLLALKKPLKRLRKAARAVERLHGDRDISAIASRADRLRSAIDRAVEKANGREVEERHIAESVISYLRD